MRDYDARCSILAAGPFADEMTMRAAKNGMLFAYL